MGNKFQPLAKWNKSQENFWILSTEKKCFLWIINEIFSFINETFDLYKTFCRDNFQCFKCNSSWQSYAKIWRLAQKKHAIKFQQKCLWNRATSCAQFTLCWCLCALHKLVCEIDSWVANGSGFRCKTLLRDFLAVVVFFSSGCYSY